jgi:hypothetical protein
MKDITSGVIVSELMAGETPALPAYSSLWALGASDSLWPLKRLGVARVARKNSAEEVSRILASGFLLLASCFSGFRIGGDIRTNLISNS